MPKIQRKDAKVAADLFEALCQEHQRLFRQKNAEYGNTIVTTGVLGATIELIGAVMRLPSLVLKDHGVSENLVEFLEHLRNDPRAPEEIADRAAFLMDSLQNSHGHGANHISALRDIFADIHNYANIALIMLEDENWDGIV